MKARIRITQTRVKYFDVDTNKYNDEVNTIEQVIELERAGAEEYYEYFDDPDEEEIEIDIVGEEQ